jgi:transposase
LKEYVSNIKETGIELEDISYEYANGKTVVIAKGYEQLYSCSLKQGEEEIIWSERRLIVYSIAYGQSQRQALQSRIDKAQQSLGLLNQHRPGKKPFKDLQEFIEAADEIITKNRVQSLFDLSFTENIEQIPQRKYKERPAGVIEKRSWKIQYTVDGRSDIKSSFHTSIFKE